MAYDIYGNHLTPGHCEVHPDVYESYPCRHCYEESERQDYYSFLQQDPMEEEYANYYYEEMYRDVFMRFECKQMWE